MDSIETLKELHIWGFHFILASGKQRILEILEPLAGAEVNLCTKTVTPHHSLLFATDDKPGDV